MTRITKNQYDAAFEEAHALSEHGELFCRHANRYVEITVISHFDIKSKEPPTSAYFAAVSDTSECEHDLIAEKGLVGPSKQIEWFRFDSHEAMLEWSCMFWCKHMPHVEP